MKYHEVKLDLVVILYDQYTCKSRKRCHQLNMRMAVVVKNINKSDLPE